jgi:hypothetical protein
MGLQRKLWQWLCESIYRAGDETENDEHGILLSPNMVIESLEAILWD